MDIQVEQTLLPEWNTEYSIHVPVLDPESHLPNYRSALSEAVLIYLGRRPSADLRYGEEEVISRRRIFFAAIESKLKI